jgi:DNA repair exonuclease SbcCD nuclease subunit
MTNNKIAILSDIHIGTHQNSVMWHNIVLNFAKWLKTDLEQKNIKDIIICGDINNNRNEISVSSINIIDKFFKELKAFNITVIVGNHDSYYKDRPDVNSLALLSEWDNIKIIDSIQSITVNDNKLTFCPWGVELKDIPETDILFGHFEIMGFKMSKTKINTIGINSKELLNKSKLVITGHFHLREERKYENGTILYVGSPYELDWGDYNTNDRGYYILDTETKAYEFVPNNISPKHKKIKLSDLLNGGITDELKLEFKNNFINFIIDKDIDTDKVSSLINKLSNLKPASIKTEFINIGKAVFDDTGYDFNGVDISASIEEFVNMLDLKYKQETLVYTIDLYKRFAK